MAAFDEPMEHPVAPNSPLPGANERGSSDDHARPPTDSMTRADVGIVPSDRFGRLRADLAEAVAEAELARVRAERDRWKAIAEERERALDRADLTLQTLVNALNTPGPAAAGAAPPTGETVEEVEPTAPQPRYDVTRSPVVDTGVARVLWTEPMLVEPEPPDVVAIPPYVRDEAQRYAETLAAMHEYRVAKEKQHWWQFWR